MGSTDPLKSYSLLKVKMNQIEKSKKNEINKETQKNDPNSSTIKSALPSKSAADVVSNKSLNNVKEVSQSPEKDLDPDTPVRTYGDFFCVVCESHMNSQGMWDSHITGKKHQKNIKRRVPDSKYEDLNVESSLKYEIRNVKDAIVGLSYIQEVRRKKPGVPHLYTCFLCHATCATPAMVIEHIIGLKHRLNYIRENSPEDYELLEATNLKKGQMEPLVTEMAVKLEQKFGSGEVKVKQEKAKPPNLSWSSKQPMTDSDEDEMSNGDRCNDRSKKHGNKNPYVWKSFDYHKRDNLKDVKDCRYIIEERRKRVYTSDEDADIHIQKDPVKRIAYYNHSKRPRPSPYFQEPSRMQKEHSRSYRAPSEDHYERYSRSPPHKLLKKNKYSSRISTRSPLREHSLSSSPPQELLKRNVHSSRISTLSPSHEHSHSRSLIHQRESPSSKNHSLPTETKNQESDSNFDVLKDFVQKVYALPIEIFLKIVLLKLDNIEVNGIDELCLLSKVITKAQAIFSNKLHPDVEAVVRQKMFRNADSLQNASIPPEINTIAKSSTESKSISSGTGFSFIRDFLNQATGKDPASSVTPSKASHYSPTSYSGSTHGNINSSSSVTPSEASHFSATHYSGTTRENLNPGYQTSYAPPSNVTASYNSASFSMTSSIPGLTLTEENKQAYTSYDTYQSQYPDPSSTNYSRYKY